MPRPELARGSPAEPRQGQRAHLRRVFDALEDPTTLIVVKPGPEFVVAAANRRAQELLGFDESEIVGKRVEEVRSAGAGATSLEEYRELVERRQPITREHTFEVGGEARVLRIALTPIVSEGCVTHILAVVSDMTSVRSLEDRARRAEDRFGALVEHSSDITLVFDENGELTYISPSIWTWLGHTPDEMLGVNIFDFVHPDDVEEAAVGLAEISRSGQPEEQQGATPVRVRHRDGSWRSVEGVMTDLREHPDVRGFVANIRDVTERNEAVDALRKSEDRFRSLAESAPIGIILTNDKGDITYSNRRFKEIFRTDVLDWRDWREVIHPDDRATVQRATSGAVEGNEFSVEYRIITPTSEVRWVQVSAVPQLDAEGVFEGAVGTVEDVTDRKNFEEHLAHQATHDPLTGLPNRVVFEDRLGQALARGQRSSQGTAVLFLDLDLFKLANDRFGHAVGDRLLQEVAARLQDSTRAGDTVARIGGDEFAMVCEAAGVAEAERIADRVLGTSREPFVVNGADIYLTNSVGIAVADSPTDVQTLMRQADAAMYRAKEGGRGRAVVYDPTHERDDSQLELTGELRAALERDELRVYYQPILDLETKRLLRLEALVRWQHPTRDLLLPADFIPVAEHAGLIVPLGSWVLDRACRQLVSWRKAGLIEPSVSVSVNVSAHQLDQPDFVPMVMDTLARTGLDARALQLEITESVLVRDPTVTMRKLEELEAKGVSLAVDDFGTGYASLMQLKRLPIHAIKIDRSFVMGLGQNAEDEAIVSATIRMAHELGIVVTAEGVETTEQLERLRTLGCDDVQGLLFAPARPPDDALGD